MAIEPPVRRTVVPMAAQPPRLAVL
jgi:hypothetical protein